MLDVEPYTKILAKILIVEDEAFIAAELEALLEEAGYQPIGIAHDSSTAIKLAIHKPDLALVDLNLRDGPTGAKIGEILTNTYKIPVLFVTANPRMLENGVPGTIGFVVKPYDLETILGSVKFGLEIHAGNDQEAPPPFVQVFKKTA